MVLFLTKAEVSFLPLITQNGQNFTEEPHKSVANSDYGSKWDKFDFPHGCQESDPIFILVLSVSGHYRCSVKLVRYFSSNQSERVNICVFTGNQVCRLTSNGVEFLLTWLLINCSYGFPPLYLHLESVSESLGLNRSIVVMRWVFSWGEGIGR